MFLLKINIKSYNIYVTHNDISTIDSILLNVGFDNDCITNSCSMFVFLARKKLQNNYNSRLRNKKSMLKIAHMKKELKYTFMDDSFHVLNCRVRCVTFLFCEENYA